MTDYELYHLIGKCIGVGFFAFLAALVFLMALSRDNGDNQ